MTGALVNKPSNQESQDMAQNKAGVSLVPSFKVTSKDQKSISDMEMAAAIASVVAYMDQEKVLADKNKNIDHIDDTYLSNWGRSNLASTRRKIGVFDPYVFKSKNLWRSLILLLVLNSLNLISATSAVAQESEEYTDIVASSQLQNQQIISSIPKPNGKTIRISLQQGLYSAVLGSLDGMDVYDAASGELCAKLNAQSQWSVSYSGSTMSLNPSRFADINKIAQGPELTTTQVIALAPPRLPRLSGLSQTKSIYTQIPWTKSKGASLFSRKFDSALQDQGLFFVPAKDNNSIFTFNNRPYRGSLLLRIQGGKFQAINVVNLEDYLLSVLPSEMPSAWPLEALKAQSIAARSYAIANLNKHAKDGYDLGSGTEDQVYRGVLQEKERTNKAVQETTGLVMTHNNKVVPAFYHSSSAGYTESHPTNTKLGYLKSTHDYDQSSPHSAWRATFSPSQLASALGPTVGRVLGVVAIERTESQRVKTLMLMGDMTNALVSGDSVRKALKLPSTNFNVICDSQSGNYVFSGQGFGHGMGMSQWGARSLAEHGWGAGEILHHFYKDVRVQNSLESDQIENSVL
ncbi:MAG: SpoIID/LytB domain-containing protein [Candidatus Melainabacteria bacterium]|nr:SpoIID/LytB domain-containing protein [Candidatus Melainabacteria bacterium]